MDAASIINRAMQLNPNNFRYWKSRGYLLRPDNWMDSKAIVTISAKILGTCGHGLVKTACFICSVKGAVLLLGCASVAAIYYSYPQMQEQRWEYALNIMNATGTVCKSTAVFVGDSSVSLAAYSAKLAKEQGPNVWYYGAVVPYSAAKSGLYYSGVGLKIFASTIGYYCGTSEESQPNK